MRLESRALFVVRRSSLQYCQALRKSTDHAFLSRTGQIHRQHFYQNHGKCENDGQNRWVADADQSRHCIHNRRKQPSEQGNRRDEQPPSREWPMQMATPYKE